MEQIVLAKYLVICALVLFIGHLSTASIDYKKNGPIGDPKEETNLDKGHLSHMIWMGPRVGRRKRDPRITEILKHQNLDQEQLAELIEIVQALKDGKGRIKLVSKLGRDSNEDNIENEAEERWLRDPEYAAGFLQRSSSLEPQPGRWISEFSSRLDRENDKTRK